MLGSLSFWDFCWSYSVNQDDFTSPYCHCGIWLYFGAMPVNPPPFILSRYKFCYSHHYPYSSILVSFYIFKCSHCRFSGVSKEKRIQSTLNLWPLLGYVLSRFIADSASQNLDINLRNIEHIATWLNNKVLH